MKLPLVVQQTLVLAGGWELPSSCIWIEISFLLLEAKNQWAIRRQTRSNLLRTHLLVTNKIDLYHSDKWSSI